MVNIGIIGAGKVGVSLGKHFSDAGLFNASSGFYSRRLSSAQEAATFTDSILYHSMRELVEKNDIIFITVPDGAIPSVWEECKGFDIAGKIFCHCSGALSSEIFQGKESKGSYGYSVHPLMAVSDRFSAYKYFTEILFTLEGSVERLDMMRDLLVQSGIHAQIIHRDAKALYHCAASLASNCMMGLTQIAIEQLLKCGFSEANARLALAPLMLGNLSNALEHGTIPALTGPVERADSSTVLAHLQVLSGEEREIYRLLSHKIVEIAEQKHPDRDYEMIRKLLQNETIMPTASH